MPRRVESWIALVMLASVLTLSAQTPAPDTAGTKPLATRDLDVEGVFAEVIESVRKGDMLTVRVRFRTGGTLRSSNGCSRPSSAGPTASG